MVDEWKPKLESISSIQDFMEFCKSFEEKSGLGRPIGIDRSGEIDVKQLEELKKYDYPPDFIDWHTHFGNYDLWLEGNVDSLNTVINTLKRIKEGDAEDLLLANGYLPLTSDGGGNFYLFDTNKQKIAFADHDNVYMGSDSRLLWEMYGEFYDFWQEQDGTYHNNKNLDLKQIFDSENQFIKTSPYIKKHLTKNIKGKGVTNFLGLLLKLTKRALEDIKHRYKDW